MPRVNFVKKARKDNPVCKKGESYYWWKFRFGSKNYSLTHPKQSQLTQSEFLSQVYDIDDRLGSIDETSNFESDIQDIISELEILREECEEKRENMPEQLQDVGSGEILQNRVDGIEDMISDLESIDIDIDSDLKDEEENERREEIAEEIKNVCYNGE